MNLDFVVFCLTVIVIVAIVFSKDKLAEKATEAVVGLANNALHIANRLKKPISRKVVDVPTVVENQPDTPPVLPEKTADSLPEAPADAPV